jgi:hypothetical protein
VGVEEPNGPFRDFFLDTGLKDQESCKKNFHGHIFVEMSKYWNARSGGILDRAPFIRGPLKKPLDCLSCVKFISNIFFFFQYQLSKRTKTVQLNI